MLKVIRIPTKYSRTINRFSQKEKAELLSMLVDIGDGNIVTIPDNILGDTLTLIYNDWVQMEAKNGNKIEFSLIQYPSGLPADIPADIPGSGNEMKGNEINEQFDIFWKAYPNKKGKKEAISKFTKLIKSGITLNQLLTAIDKYKKDTNPKYYKHGSTWLNKEVFRDYEGIEEKKREIIKEEHDIHWDI